jgi:hypothetical protein
MRPESDIQAEKHGAAMLVRMEKTGKAGADFAFAVRTAQQACSDAGLDASFSTDGAHFTPWQTAKAVRHAREDVAATLILQLSIMKRLDRIQVYCWVGLAILLYIAIRLS